MLQLEFTYAYHLLLEKTGNNLALFCESLGHHYFQFYFKSFQLPIKFLGVSGNTETESLASKNDTADGGDETEFLLGGRLCFSARGEEQFRNHTIGKGVRRGQTDRGGGIIDKLRINRILYCVFGFWNN